MNHCLSVIALSIGLYPLNPNSHKTHKQPLPDAFCVAKNSSIASHHLYIIKIIT
jgi:hypothetical protein